MAKSFRKNDRVKLHGVPGHGTIIKRVNKRYWVVWDSTPGMPTGPYFATELLPISEGSSG